MAMSKELRVDPQVLLSKSSEMKGIRSKISSVMQDTKGKFQSLSTCWESGAATTYQAQFNKVHKDIEEMLNIVDEYTSDLDAIADLVKSTEQKINDEARTLPGNVLG